MNNQKDFEELIQRQTHRPIPPAWREEILSAAHQAAAPRLANRSLLSAIGVRLSALLWPHPIAWGGLAAVWLVVVGLDVVDMEPAPRHAARQEAQPASEMRKLWRQREQMLAELVGPFENTEAKPEKPPPSQPRSQRREDFRHT